MGLSIWHILLFLLIVVLLFGTSRLRSLGKDLGGALRDFKHSMNDDEKIRKQANPQMNTQEADLDRK